MQTLENKRKDLVKYRRRKKTKKLISFIFVTCLCIYVPILIILATTTKPQSELLTIGTIKDSINVTGIVLKNEQIYIAPFDGVFAKGAGEGERIPAGYLAAYVINREYVENFNEIERLNNEIVALKRRNEINSGIFTRDLKRLNDNIVVSVASISRDISIGSLAGVDSQMISIKKNADYRNEIIGGIFSDDKYINDLTDRVALLEKAVKNNSIEVKADKPGYISYNIDGFEDKYDIKTVMSYSVNELSQLIRSKTNNTGGSGEIKQGQPYMKLINDNSFYLAFVIDNKTVDKLKGYNSVRINIDELNISINAKEMEFRDKDDKNTSVFFKVDSKLGELSGIRKINCEIVFSEYTGLKVPLSSLMNMNSYPYKQIQLAVVKDIWVRFLDVNVIVDNGTFAIIESPDKRFSLYDRYILKPEKVEEGQSVR